MQKKKMMPFTNAQQKFDELRKLPVGWDYGYDGPPSERAFKSGYALLYSFQFLKVDAFEVLPGRSHGIALVAIKGQYAAEIHINSDGTYNLVHEHAGQEIADEQGVGLNKLICKLEEQGWRSARLFVSCIRGDTVRVWGDTSARLLAPEQIVACRSSVGTVSMHPIPKYVPMLQSSMTNELQGRRQSSGEYRAVRFQQAYT